MIISELIGVLQEYKSKHGDVAVVHSKDSEGNAFHPLSVLSAESAEDLSAYYIELGAEDTPVNCVVVWP